MTALENNEMMCMIVWQAWERHVGNPVLTEILHAAAVTAITTGNKPAIELFEELQFLRELAWARVEMSQHERSMAVVKSYMLKEQAS